MFLNQKIQPDDRVVLAVESAARRVLATLPFVQFFPLPCPVINCKSPEYLASLYNTAHDISWWVSTGLDRMLLPGLLLAWVGGVGIGLLDRSQG